MKRAQTEPKEKLIWYSKVLPEICGSFLLETGTERAISTRITYAKVLLKFFTYGVNNLPSLNKANEINKISKEMIACITSQEISRYLSACANDEQSEKTIARERATLSSFFKYLVNNELVEKNPVLSAVKIRIHSTDNVIHLTPEEQNHFVEAIYSGVDLDKRKQAYHKRYALRDAAIVTILLDTGMRVSELQGLNIGNVDFEKHCLLAKRKGGNKQTLYFSDEAGSVLLEYINSRVQITPSDPLFTTVSGERLSIRSIEVLVKKYASSSLPGKDKITPHKMRSSFAMTFYSETMDILALQKKLGHKSLAATNIYAKATDKRMEETRDIVANARKKAQV